MKFGGIIFDFDGVLIESEYIGNSQIAAYLTAIGHPTSVEQSMANFIGLSGSDFLAAIEQWIGRPVPDDFHFARRAEDDRVMREGIDEVAGAVSFVVNLPQTFPKAIASSSSTRWITRHLDHLKLRDVFEPMIFSGAEHVAKGKPAPDLYLHAAAQIGVPIAECVIVEDSPVGVTGAVASGAYVIGLTAGQHCGPDHAAVLRSLGVHAVACDFTALAEMIF